MARRRRRRPPGGHTTAAGSRGRRAPFSTDFASHTHAACSPVYVDVVECAPASRPPASSSLTHTCRMDGFCNQNADQLGSLAGLSFPAICRCTFEATPLSATSAELVLGLGLGLGLGSHSSYSHASSHAPLLLATFHTISHSLAFTSCVTYSASGRESPSPPCISCC